MNYGLQSRSHCNKKLEESRVTTGNVTKNDIFAHPRHRWEWKHEIWSTFCCCLTALMMQQSAVKIKPGCIPLYLRVRNVHWRPSLVTLLHPLSQSCLKITNLFSACSTSIRGINLPFSLRNTTTKTFNQSINNQSIYFISTTNKFNNKDMYEWNRHLMC